MCASLVPIVRSEDASSAGRAATPNVAAHAMTEIAVLISLCVLPTIGLTHPLSRRLRRSGKLWTARAVTTAAVVVGLGLAVGAFALIIGGLGDAQPASIRLRNGTNRGIILVQPRIVPSERSAAAYTHIPPGSHGFPG